MRKNTGFKIMVSYRDAPIITIIRDTYLVYGNDIYLEIGNYLKRKDSFYLSYLDGTVLNHGDFLSRKSEFGFHNFFRKQAECQNFFREYGTTVFPLQLQFNSELEFRIDTYLKDVCLNDKF